MPRTPLSVSSVFRSTRVHLACLSGVAALLAATGAASPALAEAQVQAQGDNFPPFEKAIEGLTKVNSNADGSGGYWDLYEDRKTGRMLAVLPKNYEGKLMMISCTVSGGDSQAGVMGPTIFAQWERIGDKLALVAPNLSVRTDGDQQAKDSIDQLFTGRVILSAPIVSMAPGDRPVIDFGTIATRQTSSFFGSAVYGSYGPSLYAIDSSLAKITKSKAFPENVLVEYQAPRRDGRIVRLTYGIQTLEGSKGFQPRKADARVGYFYSSHSDFAKPANEDVTERYINRWNLEKADPSMRLSPPKQPIVWYVEHTTPIKFRRYVRDGIAMWNKAFEAVGIVGAIEVYQQDSASGAHMDKDPEDARYNFFRWNASDQGYAIGPSRANPLTGEILDADVVWHQGLTRAVRGMYTNFSDDITEQSFSPEALAFFSEHPGWDPRVLLAEPARRAQILSQRALETEKATETQLGTAENPWTTWAADHANTSCKIGNMLSLDMSLADAALTLGVLDAGDSDLLEGLPEEYLGAMIRYISAHEVGHCLGLQHNMAASTIRTNAEINSEDFEGPTIGSVMDYVAANINAGPLTGTDLGNAQGAFATPEVGPYDMWAIAFGYGPADKVDEVLAQSAQPDHLYIAQTAMSVGSDPRNMTWDMGKDNLAFAEGRLALIRKIRERMLTDIVDEGESWAVARRRYNTTLGSQVQAMSIAAPYIGGSYSSNSFKGDTDATTPISDVPADEQRRALNLIMDCAFEDSAFGLTPELVRHMGKEYWWDDAGISELMADPSYTVHNLVAGVQGTGLSFIMNPTRLRRVYDNEFRAEGGDTLTLAEVVRTVTDRVWSELSEKQPAISSFRRSLQREHIERLTTLTLLRSSDPTLRTISTLAAAELRRIDDMAEKISSDDAYVAAHLSDARTRIARALDAAYVVGK